jgi:hypothetical protein
VKIDDYFDGFERGLHQNTLISKVDQPIALLSSDDYNGLIRIRAHFWDNSFLDIYEVVSTELGYPVRITYSYTYLRNEQQVFRYDNAPHHPEIATHPHHKHLGSLNKLAPADQPSISQILTEIAEWLDQLSISSP